MQGYCGYAKPLAAIKKRKTKINNRVYEQEIRMGNEINLFHAKSSIIFSNIFSPKIFRL